MEPDVWALYGIAGAHLTLEEARARFGEEYARRTDGGTIDAVEQGWLRYEFIGENNSVDWVDANHAAWLYSPLDDKPRGVVRPVTVIPWP
jgi:hypothetical protein